MESFLDEYLKKQHIEVPPNKVAKVAKIEGNRKLNWPIQGDHLFQFISIDEKDEIEQLIRKGETEEVLTILRASYKWVKTNKNLYPDAETVLKNVQIVAQWIKKNFHIQVFGNP